MSDSTNNTDPLSPEQLIHKYQNGIWRYLRVLGCEASLAEDITQETFLKVIKKGFEQYNDAATAGYLRKVAYNLFISVQRREGKNIVTNEVERLDASWDKWAGADNGDTLLGMLRECLEGLTERARSALELRFRKEQTRAAIANHLQITEDGAKNLMQRAKKQLRDCVDHKNQAELN
ncbi:MAG: RNA polymerase subunit sigma-70 [Planctomycetaceae bacterium]|nr:RNA polymerase subunit sigma-70 [Planctomycetaceae bacterium]|tara:strand:+ start:412 stop:942 length:531 start_codon:yes stop_codon:yes gene_type:complete